MGKRIGNWFYYSGVIHIHTTDSDGTKSIEEIIALGQEVGVDFVMFTDHMTLAGRESGKEGLHNGMLVVIGYEHNDPNDKHHYLLFDSPRVYPREISVRDLVKTAAADGRTRPFRSYPWLDWSADSFQGLEIWNQMSEWMDKLTPFNKVMLAFSPRKSMIGPREQTMKRWDELNMSRKVAGIASPDAHAYQFKIWPMSVEIFPYKVHFKTLRTHIILPEPLSKALETARGQLYDAIRDCRLFTSNMRWGIADGFEFSANNGLISGIAGSSVPLTDNTVLFARLPQRATVKVVANGEVILQTITDQLEFRVSEPGIYRVEAWKDSRGWIFSNHIRIIAQQGER
jgi:hypothetical protein